MGQRRWSDTLANRHVAEQRIEEVIAGAATDLPDRPEDLRWRSWRRWLLEVAQMLVSLLVPLAEEIVGGGNGGRKKELVLETIVRIYEAAGINVPWVPHALERGTMTGLSRRTGGVLSWSLGRATWSARMRAPMGGLCT